MFMYVQTEGVIDHTGCLLLLDINDGVLARTMGLSLKACL